MVTQKMAFKKIDATLQISHFYPSYAWSVCYSTRSFGYNHLALSHASVALTYFESIDLQYLAAPVASRSIIKFEDCISSTSPAFCAASLMKYFALSFQIAETVRTHLILSGNVLKMSLDSRINKLCLQ